MRATIYTANLHHGGGASGASTFVSDLPVLYEGGELSGFQELEVVVSSLVASNLPDLRSVHRIPGVTVTVRDDAPDLSALWRPRQAGGPDAQLIVRGPHYGPLYAGRNVLGFADGTMYFPRPEGLGESQLSRVTHASKNVLKRRLVPRYDEFVVQTERMANRLRREVGPKPIWIVPNSPSPVFSDKTRWESVALPSRDGDAVRLFYPARGYSHKNHALIGATGDYLRATYGVEFEVVVTLRPAEFDALPPRVQEFCINIGEVTLSQCPSLYLACDGVFFPSLNETSSATPLEGMLMGRPVFASDRDFVRETAGDVPFYFDPLDAASAGETIMKVLRSEADWDARLEAGEAFARALPSPLERSRAYIRILRGV